MVPSNRVEVGTVMQWQKRNYDDLVPSYITMPEVPKGKNLLNV
jgi:hypothetical protein